MIIREIPVIEAEEIGNRGPTGRRQVVQRAELRDAGGNVWATARTPEEMRQTAPPQGVHTEWYAAELGRVLGDDERGEESI